MNDVAPHYDIEQQTADSRKDLEVGIPARLHEIYQLLGENSQGLEPWRLALVIDLVQSVEHNCGELSESLGKDRLPTAAWIARNLLELWVWIKYCGVSRDNAWYFHADALRDLKRLTENYNNICNVLRIENETSKITASRIKDVATEKLALDDINTKPRTVECASKMKGVDLDGQFAPFNKFLSKFAHPTAFLLHGIMHQPEICRHLQAMCITQGIHFAMESILAVEAQLGIRQTVQIP
jgi:hypothetical protein